MWVDLGGGRKEAGEEYSKRMGQPFGEGGVSFHLREEGPMVEKATDGKEGKGGGKSVLDPKGGWPSAQKSGEKSGRSWERGGKDEARLDDWR